MPALIRNKGLESITLPYPFKGVLAPGAGTILNDTAANILTALGTIAQDSTLKVSDISSTTYDAFRIGVHLTGGFIDGDDLASNANGKGLSQIGIEDALGIIAATDGEGALAENRTAIDLNTTHATGNGSDHANVATNTAHVIGDGSDHADVATNTADMDTHRPGIPMQNRIRILGAPGVIVAGDTVTIGGDIYEANANTPPSGGTAGSIWVYQDASSAAFRGHLINAINGVVDAANITYDGAVTELMLAAAGITTGDVLVQSADAIGGTAAPSGTATVCTEVLTTVTDIWDQGTMYSGALQVASQAVMASVTLTAAQIAKGTLEVNYGFTPLHCMIVNRSRPQDEAYTITGDAVSLTLTGGGSPNNQAGDVLDVIAFG